MPIMGLNISHKIAELLNNLMMQKARLTMFDTIFEKAQVQYETRNRPFDFRRIYGLGNTMSLQSNLAEKVKIPMPQYQGWPSLAYH